MTYSWKHIGGAFMGLLVACIGLWNYQQGFAATDTLLVAYLDVGQGDATYIRAPNGNDVLIDGGPDDGVMGQLARIMPAFDQDIDMVVATHPDKDHIAGLPAVFDGYDVHYFLHTETQSDSSLDENLLESAANEDGLESIFARRGQRFIIDDTHGVYIDVLFPDQDTSDFKETNESSIITRLVYGTQSFLITGDAYVSNEQFLIGADGTSLQTTVLKLGHHGSKTSTSDAFLEAVKPELAIVSAGKNNSYKHPAASVVERVKAKNIPILSTIDQGTIVLKTDGRRLWKD